MQPGTLYAALRERGRALKLLIFLSALLTGLTGALAGEQRASLSPHSVSHLLAVAEQTEAVPASASRPALLRPSALPVARVLGQDVADAIAKRPLDMNPGRLRL